jgi:hypothetical protein
MASNPRIRGKIPHSEWPKITQRFRDGEPLTTIARSYHCTAPAIRYIVQRTTNAATSNGDERRREIVDRSSLEAVRADSSAEQLRKTRTAAPPISNAFWQRLNSDIAAFLSAMDALLLDDSPDNRKKMLEAADLLLRAGGRTRLEIELLDNRKKGLRMISNNS